MPMTDDTNAPPECAAPRFGPATAANPLWWVVAAGGALFCLSCLLWLTAGISNPEAPGTVWLNRHGFTLIVVTSSVAIAAALAAMATDRRQTVRLQQSSVRPATDDDADPTEPA